MTKKNEHMRKVSIDCPVALLERLDRIADLGEISRQKLIVNLLDVGVGYLEASNKVGVFAWPLIFHDLRKVVNEWSDHIRKVEVLGLSHDLQ